MLNKRNPENSRRIDDRDRVVTINNKKDSDDGINAVTVCTDIIIESGSIIIGS